MDEGKIRLADREMVGVILHESDENYTLDFSLNAKAKEYAGDYSVVTVPKNKCARRLE